MWPFPPRANAGPTEPEPPPPSLPFVAETIVAEIEFAWPEASRRIFTELGLRCHGCVVGETDTIREVARLHEKPLEAVLDGLNRAFTGVPPEGMQGAPSA